MTGNMRAGSAPESDPEVSGLHAITFDFANTLVPVRRSTFRLLVDQMLGVDGSPVASSDRAAFVAAWEQERDRQFAEDVPAGREVDLEQRIARVLARLRGVAPPPATVPWDDDAARAKSGPVERASLLEAYSDSLATAAPPPAAVGALLHRLHARGLRLGILSNWPLAAAIERYVHVAGWATVLATVVVSQRVGAIKPSPRIFAVAAAELGVSGAAILHVGDDWTADVVGARNAGWRAGFLRGQEPDWPRQPIDPSLHVTPDIVIDRLEELEVSLERFESASAAGD